VPIPEFQADGYLPEGVHQATEGEVLFRFGSPTPHRRFLALRLRHWLTLSRAVGAVRFFVDGSFVTSKPHPGDVDAVVRLPTDFEQKVQAEFEPAVELDTILTTRQPEELFAAEDEADWSGWVEFFTRTRETDGRRKGGCGDSPMIADANEYTKACQELEHLEAWLSRLRQEHPTEKGLTKAGLRKMIARLHEELAIYEGHLEVQKEHTH